MKIVAIQNGARKLSEGNVRLLKAIKSAYHTSFDIRQTSFSGEATSLTVQSIHEGCSLLIVLGGDGTIHEVVNGLKQIQKKIPLLILPNGTANDLARGLDLSWTSEKLLSAIDQMHFREIDLIKIVHEEKVKWCVNISDVGFGGKVVQLLHGQRKFVGGSLSYVLAIIRSFVTYRKPIVLLKSEEHGYHGPILLAACCNGPMFGDGLYIAPEAKIDDGWMHVTLLGKVDFLDYLRNLSRLKRKKQIKHPEAYYFKTRKLELQINSGIAFTEADGELIGEGNIAFEIEPASLRLIVPFEE